jgi:hypothetical protein
MLKTISNTSLLLFDAQCPQTALFNKWTFSSTLTANEGRKS